MLTSTLADKGQTTVPWKIRKALELGPRQRLVWENRPDGSAVIRPLPSVMELAGCLKSKVLFPGTREETEAATAAWGAESVKPAHRFAVASFDRDLDKFKDLTRFEPG